MPLQQIGRKLAAAPNDPHRRHAVADAQMRLGQSVQPARPQEAERLYRDAIAGNMRLTGEFPHTTQYRTDLAEAHHGLFLLAAGLALKIGVADVLVQFVRQSFETPAQLATTGRGDGPKVGRYMNAPATLARTRSVGRRWYGSCGSSGT